MVGIPGKSKGCITCRRRKVGCDQARPACGRCTKSGRNCEGYSRYPVFINRNETGLVKRNRLEEVKVTPSPQPLVRCQTVSWFWEHDASKVQLVHPREGKVSWLYHVMNMSNPTPVLEQAVLALASTRLGRASANASIFHDGRRQYNQALRLLQQALFDQEAVCDDATLASVRVMILYEFFESTSEDNTAWFNHLEGMSKLLLLRGPERNSGVLAKSIWEDVRYPLMTKAIMQRQASTFGETAWLSKSEKGWDQRFLDQGFQMAGFLERVDRINVTEVEENTQLLRDLDACDAALEKMSVTMLRDRVDNEREQAQRLLMVVNMRAMQLLSRLLIIGLLRVLPESEAAVQKVKRSGIVNNEQLAQQIKSGVELCLEEDFKQYGSNRTIFACSILLWYFRKGTPDFEKILAIKQIVGNQMRFASHMRLGMASVPALMRSRDGCDERGEASDV